MTRSRVRDSLDARQTGAPATDIVDGRRLLGAISHHRARPYRAESLD